MVLALPVEPAWPVLHDAQRRVLSGVLIHGDQSRTALAERLGLSRTGMSRLVKDMWRQPFDFSHYAQGAAITALQSLIQ